MRLIWHGTASIEVRCSRGNLLFDPFVPLKGSQEDVTIEGYDGFNDIFVTHGHFDHISSIPCIVKRNSRAKIYCTQTPYRTLCKRGVAEDNLVLIHYGQMLRLNGFLIQIFRGRHAVLPKVSFSRAVSLLKSPHRGNLPHIIREHWSCREKDETVFYQIEAEGKTLSLMGSMNLRDDVEYPRHADILVLPYNGWADNFPPAARTIERLKPKRVVLDHFDDAFPPVTMPLDLSPLMSKYAGMVTPMVRGRAEQV